MDGACIVSALTFTVHSEPVGKGRHRTIRNGARAGHSYTPKRTTDAQNAIAAAFGAVAHPEGFNPLDGAVRLEVSARFAIPKSASKKRRAELMGTPCLKKPDGDNIL